MKIKLIDFGLEKDHYPFRPHENDAGADVYMPYDCTLKPGEIQLINTCTNRSLVGAAETAAPPDPGKSRVSPGNYIAKINGVHREVMCWHLLSTTHAGCNTRELIPLWHLLGRLPLASRLAVAHGEVHR